MFGMAKWLDPGQKKKEGTALTELHINHMRDAHDIIGISPESWMPVSLVPAHSRSRCFCMPCCWASVPHGFTAVVTRWGADIHTGGDQEDGDGWDSGFHCMPPWNRVARLISRQYFVFDAPVRDCKTKDNCSASIDVLIVFQITNARAFCYGLGPEKLDDLLRASQEEVLRQMAGDTEVADIYDLFGKEKTDPYVDSMNAKFHDFGVNIVSFTIRNVSIPQTMAKDFEDKTLFLSKTVETEMTQESDKNKMNNDEELQKYREQQLNVKMAAEEKAIFEQLGVSKETGEVQAFCAKAISLAKANRTAQVTDIEANGGITVAGVQAQQSVMQSEHRNSMQKEVDKMDAEVISYENSKLHVGSKEATATIAEGKKALFGAEGDAAEAFSARRYQEQCMMQLNILEQISNNPRISVVTSLENNTGLAPNNSLVTQVTQQGMEAVRMKLADLTSKSASSLDMGHVFQGGLVRPMPQQQMKPP